MKVETDNMGTSLADQLASIENKLEAKSDQVELLAEIQQGIGRLLEASGGNEAGIRAVLEQRHEAGELRQETFQLVMSTLDRLVNERVTSDSEATWPERGSSPARNAAPPPADDRRGRPDVGGEVAGDVDDEAVDDEFSATAVIPPDTFRNDSPEERIQIGSVLRDRFLLREQVSGGSMGVVYKALDRRLAEAGSEHSHVAIKVLSPQLSNNVDALRALQQEAAKGRNLNHPNIVRFIDLDRDDELYFIVMEWLEGRTLADILDSEDSASIDHDRALEIVRQVGAALDYAHRRGIVHADVKPANVMMLADGGIKLFDFGIARVLQKRTDGAQDFDPGVLGAMTPAYSSMQVLTGEEPVPADDVFAAGCLLYRLLAGYRVFGPRNAAEAAEEGMKPQRPAGLGDEQWGALRKSLSYSRVTRFDTMAAFLEALDTGVVELEVPRAENRVIPSSGRRFGGWWTTAAVIGLVAAAGVVAERYGWLPVVRQADEAADGVLPAGVSEPAPGEDGDRLEAAVVEPPTADTTDASGTTAAMETTAEAAPAASTPAAGEALALLETADADVIADVVDDPVAEDLAGPIELTTLLPADLTITLSYRDPMLVPVRVALREDDAPLVVEFRRAEGIDYPLSLRLEEADFSGNRSPWTSAQLRASGDGRVEFAAGQDRAQVTLSMASDTLREADQQSTLRLREVEMAAAELAILEVTLEDDDQRSFEAGLAPNSVAFAMPQMAVRERDPAAQIDIVRYKPDDQPLTVEFMVYDITARSGEDYFAPAGNSIDFGPGQRAARILIPLVQDSEAEGDEAFIVELSGAEADAGLYRRIAVLIRDDD